MTKVFAEFEDVKDREHGLDTENLNDYFQQESGWLEESGLFLNKSVAVNASDGYWGEYIAYLITWAIEHKDDAFRGMSPVCFDEWYDNEYQEEYEDE